jgi:hypothetical protein
MKKPHKHAELIKAWADGAEIEYRVKDGKLGWSGWKSFDSLERFLTDPWWDYRIKPAPKPDVVYYGVYNPEDARTRVVDLEFCFTKLNDEGDHIKLTFDGETGKLKSAEVL